MMPNGRIGQIVETLLQRLGSEIAPKIETAAHAIVSAQRAELRLLGRDLSEMEMSGELEQRVAYESSQLRNLVSLVC